MKNDRTFANAVTALEAALQPGTDPGQLRAAITAIELYLPERQGDSGLLPAHTVQALQSTCQDLAESPARDPDPALLTRLTEGMAQLQAHFTDPLEGVWQSEHVLETRPLPWLVRDWLPHATVSVLSGQGSTGKSRIALQLAVAVSMGWPRFLPTAPKKPDYPLPEVNETHCGPVVYAAWETGRVALNRRRDAVLAALSAELDPNVLDGKLHFLHLGGKGGLWGVEHAHHMATMGGVLRLGHAVLEQVAAKQPKLLILDPVAAAFVQNENDRSLVRSFLTALRAWAEETDCAVLLIQHPAKSGQDAQSGSTDWRNGVHGVWELKAVDDDTGSSNDGAERILRVDKLNEGVAGTEIALCWDNGAFAACPLPTKLDKRSKRDGRPQRKAVADKHSVDLNPNGQIDTTGMQ